MNNDSKRVLSNLLIIIGVIGIFATGAMYYSVFDGFKDKNMWILCTIISVIILFSGVGIYIKLWRDKWKNIDTR